MTQNSILQMKLLKNQLKDEIIKEGQFPYRRRKYQYQSIEEENMIGIRNMNHRYSVLDLPDDFSNKTVLDLGCSLGMVCVMAKLRNASFCVGLDNNENTINVAKKYIEEKKYKDIKLFVYDINKGVNELISLIGQDKFDYVFALSIIKHVNKNILFEIINFYTKDICWFESHSKQDRTKIEKMLRKNLTFKEIKFLGYTNDRGIRSNFKIKELWE